MYSIKDFRFKKPTINYHCPFPSGKKKNVSIKKTRRYHRNRREIPKIVRSRIDDHEIVYGARALNKRFPHWLDKPTIDYDIYSPHPKCDARETERALDRKFGGDYFFVQPACHPGTYRVRSHVDGEVYADYTKPEERIPFDTIDGVKYVRLGFVKRKTRDTLKDPDSSYRHDYDRDVLNRIRLYEKMKKKGRR